MSRSQKTLGSALRSLRNKRDWTLRQMSEHSGIPISTLSKVEHDHLTLTYDKLQQLSSRLNIRMSELFAEEEAESTATILGRRSSIGSVENALKVVTPNYDYFYLCTEMRLKRMVPNLMKVKSKTVEEFGPLVRHAGEEFAYVIDGDILLHTEFYDPVRLSAGQSIYFDSSMGHAYLLAPGCEGATVIGCMASGDDDLLSLLLETKKKQAASFALA